MSENKVHTILLADDNPENLDVLSKILSEDGYKTRTAQNGALALKSIKASPPDLALIDIHMPVMDGYELCKAIKSDPELSQIPVLFISAIGEAFNKLIAFDLGAVDYLQKPVDTREVKARVSNQIKILDLQKSLKNKNKELEKTVSERTEALNVALENLQTMHARLSELDKAKDDFLSLISHELRTPMVGLGIADEFLSGRELSPEESKDYQNIFWTCHQKLISIVDHATVLTRIDLDKKQKKRTKIRIRSIVEKAIIPLEPLKDIQHVSVTKEGDSEALINCEIEYATIAFGALIETALKFATKDTLVKIKWDENDQNTCLIIESSGWTLPDNHKNKFFEVLGIREAIFPGGDLGLAPAVASQIARAFGGDVTVKNRGSEGITLELIWPKQDAI